MIKLSIVTTIVLVFFTFYSTSVKAKANKKVAIITLEKTTKSGGSNELLTRLNTIKIMDKSALTKTELNQLLQEVNQINVQLKVIDGGLYISAGALIVILIVLIFLI